MSVHQGKSVKRKLTHFALSLSLSLLSLVLSHAVLRAFFLPHVVGFALG
jgi:hypothetical protein